MYRSFSEILFFNYALFISLSFSNLSFRIKFAHCNIAVVNSSKYLSSYLDPIQGLYGTGDQ